MNERTDEQNAAMAQVCLDLHKALGVKWGSDPYAAIARLKKRTSNQRRALRQLNKAHATLWKVLGLQAEHIVKARHESANRFYRLMGGLDIDSYNERAEHIMQQSLDGLTIGPTNRTGVKALLAEHFEAVATLAKSKEQP